MSYRPRPARGLQLRRAALHLPLMTDDSLNPAPASRDIWTVNRLNLEVQGVLEGSFGLLWIEGEISNLSRPASGHLYFSLKDDRAQVSAAMFRGRNSRLRFTPRNGQQVLVRARVTLYAPRGGYQLVVEHMEEAGEGRLRREFEQLKAQLNAEGLFDPASKQALPPQPRQIGVITSASGAALRDILHVLARRCPQVPVLIYPAAVQGKDAPAQLRQALARALSRNECDVLILARGGGSLEDLWAFNNEQLARDVAAASLPIVSAVGHEIDFTLTDFVADVRAPTPSAAAELVSPDSGAQRSRVDTLSRQLGRRMQETLQRQRSRLEMLERRLPSPTRLLENTAQRLDDLNARLGRQVQQQLLAQRLHLKQLQHRLNSRDPRQQLDLARQRLQGLQHRLALPLPRSVKHTQSRLRQLVQRLDVASPLATLERGYSITLQEGEALRSVTQTGVGRTVSTRLRDGDIVSTVVRVDVSDAGSDSQG